MGYASWSVVFGEQPSAAKWNILGTNDSSFNDGTGIGAGAILPNHLFAAASSNNNWAWDTWTPSYGGFSGTPTTNFARYLKVGKTVFYRLQMSGTSNATTATFTLPVAAGTNNLNSAHIIDINDNSANAIGIITYANSSTTVTAWKVTALSSPFGAFTSSGTKGIDVQHFYET